MKPKRWCWNGCNSPPIWWAPCSWCNNCESPIAAQPLWRKPPPSAKRATLPSGLRMPLSIWEAIRNQFAWGAFTDSTMSCGNPADMLILCSKFCALTPSQSWRNQDTLKKKNLLTKSPPFWISCFLLTIRIRSRMLMYYLWKWTFLIGICMEQMLIPAICEILLERE